MLSVKNSKQAMRYLMCGLLIQSFSVKSFSKEISLTNSINNENCKDRLIQIAEKISENISKKTDNKGFNIKQEINDSWLQRLALNKQNDGTWSKECKQQLREVLLLSREYEDSFYDEKSQSKFPYLLKNNSLLQDNQSQEMEGYLQSGDIVLRRSGKMESAIVVNMTEVRGRFSHLSLVDHDGEKIRILEVNPVGLVYQTWSEFLDYFGGGHIAVYRLKKNSKTSGRRASQYLRNLVGKLKYNFTGVIGAYEDRMFCSESVSVAYNKSSEGKLIVPENQSNLSGFFQTPFAEKLGLKIEKTFVPGDMEVDSRFELVFEKRDPVKILRIKRFAAVFRSYLGWIENKGYQLSNNLDSKLAYLEIGIPFIRGIRNLGFLKEITPDDVPKKTMMLLAYTFIVSDRILGFVEDEDNNFYKKNGYYMNEKKLAEVLEGLRKSDCQLFVKNQIWDKSLEAKSWPGVVTRPPAELSMFHKQFNGFGELNNQTDFSKLSCD